MIASTRYGLTCTSASTPNNSVTEWPSLSLFVAKRGDRIEDRGSPRRPDPEQNPNRGGKREGDQDSGGADRRVAAEHLFQDDSRARAGGDANRAAGDTEHDR